MKNLLGKEKDKRLIAFTTQEKIMGLMLLPLDGNPYRYMGVIAHPGIIKEMKPAANSNYIFTTGGKDFTINIWRYDSGPMVEAVRNGGEGLEPFLELLEGGKNGAKYKEMVDFFYYAQISAKTENTTKHRVLDQTVSVSSQIRGLLSSLGYYPSTKEVNYITSEVKYSKIAEGKGDKSDDINFEAFVKIYLNHRPYVEMDVDTIENAFEKMRVSTNYHCQKDVKDIPKYVLEKVNLIKALKEKNVDENTINKILSYLDPNPEPDVMKEEHYKREIKLDILGKTLDNYCPNIKEQIIKQCISTDLNPNSSVSITYKIISNVIHRDDLVIL